ncbi:MAG: TIM barrel protein [Phycisphaerales bacterium]|nr:TIM barrel protein [Phycisphaerales bacterium]
MSNHERVSRRTVLGQATAGFGAAILAGQARGEQKAGIAPGRLRQSVCTWCYASSMSLDELCRHAARIGYQAVDLVAPDGWSTLRKHGLLSSMVPGGGSIERGFNRREHHEELVAKLRQIIDQVADAGFENVICFSGNRQEQPDEEGIRSCVDGLKQVVGHAERRKVNICMEYLNSKVDHVDYQFDNMAFGVAVARQIGSPRFGLLYDIYHAQIMEGDIIRTIREHHEYILHYHTGGNPGRNDIDETQELYYPAIMRAIADTGFKGFVGQEFMPKGDPVKAMERAFEICTV